MAKTWLSWCLSAVLLVDVWVWSRWSVALILTLLVIRVELEELLRRRPY